MMKRRREGDSRKRKQWGKKRGENKGAETLERERDRGERKQRR
jgi:hypothetical protein